MDTALAAETAAIAGAVAAVSAVAAGDAGSGGAELIWGRCYGGGGGAGLPAGREGKHGWVEVMDGGGGGRGRGAVGRRVYAVASKNTLAVYLSEEEARAAWNATPMAKVAQL